MRGFIFLVLLFLSRKSCQVDVTTAAHVSKAVADLFESSCIVLFRPNGASLKEDHELFGILKIMFENERTKSVAIKDMKKDDISYRYNRQRCSQMIHVIYGDYTSYWFEVIKILKSLFGSSKQTFFAAWEFGGRARSDMAGVPEQYNYYRRALSKHIHTIRLEFYHCKFEWIQGFIKSDISSITEPSFTISTNG